jgi:CoA:oxalate CoA-transferase
MSASTLNNSGQAEQEHPMNNAESDVPAPGGPLAGFRVVEMTTMVAGPGAGQILADFGAEVIRIEPPEGDPARQFRPLHKGASGLFAHFNRNKKSVVLDTRAEHGVELAKRIIATADIFIQNAKLGVMERLGLGYDTLRADNPGLIYLSMNGFGEAGPYARQPTYDFVVQGIAGFMYGQGGGDDKLPQHVRSGVVDKITAFCGAMAAMGALLGRGQSGQGQRVDVSMLNSYASFILPEMMSCFTFGDMPDEDRQTPSADIYQLLETSDGYATGAIVQPAQFTAICQALGREDLLADQRFQTMSGLLQNQRAVFAELSKATRGMTKQDVLDLALRIKVPLGPVHRLSDFFEDSQVRASETYVDFVDPELGPMRLLNSFANFERTPTRVRARSPHLGEHNTEVLSSVGLSAEEIEALTDETTPRKS